MSDVLTPEEREFIEAQRYKRGQGIWTQVVFRIVAEVERLRKTDLQWPHIVTPCVCCESMRASLKEALK